jgi:hypothetical protein
LKERKPGTLSEPVELTDSQLDMVAGGQATAFVTQRNKAHIFIGNNGSVTNTGGSVYIGSGNVVTSDQSNGNSGNFTATETLPATASA